MKNYIHYRDATPEEQRKRREHAEKAFPVHGMGENARDACIAERLGIESYEYLEDLAADALATADALVTKAREKK